MLSCPENVGQIPALPRDRDGKMQSLQAVANVASVLRLFREIQRDIKVQVGKSSLTDRPSGQRYHRIGTPCGLAPIAHWQFSSSFMGCVKKLASQDAVNEIDRSGAGREAKTLAASATSCIKGAPEAGTLFRSCDCKKIHFLQYHKYRLRVGFGAPSCRARHSLRNRAAVACLRRAAPSDSGVAWKRATPSRSPTSRHRR